MTSLERRREARYQRRKAKREEKKKRHYASYDDYKNIYSYSALFYANKISLRNVSWKTSVQRYQMNLLRNISETHNKLIKNEDITKGFVEFDLIERGRLRHIRSVHYSERVVQRSTCDNALVPMLQRSLIYDNGACLKGKGVDRSLNRLKAHLQQFYRANNFSNEGYIAIFDFSSYFDNILHEKCFQTFDSVFADENILSLLHSFVTPFGYPNATENWKRSLNIHSSDMYTGKSLGLGSQISQITAVSYPNALDHYIKQVLHVKWYGRYMDDGYMIFKTKEEAKLAIAAVIEYSKSLGIVINKKKTKLCRLGAGFKFLKTRNVLTSTGKVVRRMCPDSITRQRRKLKKFKRMLEQGIMSLKDISCSYGSWKGYALHRGGYLSVRKMDMLFERLFGIPTPQCKLQ